LVWGDKGFPALWVSSDITSPVEEESRKYMFTSCEVSYNLSASFGCSLALGRTFDQDSVVAKVPHALCGGLPLLVGIIFASLDMR
jgi:hypothetical protein